MHVLQDLNKSHKDIADVLQDLKRSYIDIVNVTFWKILTEVTKTSVVLQDPNRGHRHQLCFARF